MSVATGPVPSPGPARVVALVAARELRTRVRTKAFVLSTAVILAVVVLGQVAVAVLAGDDDPASVAVAGPAAEEVAEHLVAAADLLEADVVVDQAPDEAAARAQVVDRGVDLAVVTAVDGTFTLVSEDEPPATLRAVADTAVRELALTRALQAQDVDTERFLDDLAGTEVAMEVLDPADPDEAQRVTLAYFAVLLLFFTVYLYGLYVAMGVVEEKASRVVELLLATVRPLHLLVGKVAGIGAVGLLQVVVFGGAALATGLATGLVTVGTTAVALFGVAVVWYVLGFTFFAVLYAALGSLVSRQEDVNAATMPLSVLAFGTFIAAQSALTDAAAGWAGVLAWVPPFSATVVPIRVAAGVAGPGEVAGTVVVMLVAMVGAAVLAARVYESSVLSIGARRSLRSVLRG